eukprot:292628-Chlamydomonas_euryale.AAC.1
MKPTYKQSEGRAVEHEIELKPGEAPTERGVVRLNPEELEELEKQLQEFTDRGLIEPSNSPYGAP